MTASQEKGTWFLGKEIDEWIELPKYELPRWQDVHTKCERTLGMITEHLKRSPAKAVHVNIPELREPPLPILSTPHINRSMTAEEREEQATKVRLHWMFERQWVRVHQLEASLGEIESRVFAGHHNNEMVHAALRCEFPRVKKALGVIENMLMQSEQMVDRPDSEECREREVAEAVNKSKKAEGLFQAKLDQMNPKKAADNKRMVLHLLSTITASPRVYRPPVVYRSQTADNADSEGELEMSNMKWHDDNNQRYFKSRALQPKANELSMEIPANSPDSGLSPSPPDFVLRPSQSLPGSPLEVPMPDELVDATDSSSNCSTSRESSPLEYKDLCSKRLKNELFKLEFLQKMERMEMDSNVLKKTVKVPSVPVVPLVTPAVPEEPLPLDEKPTNRRSQPETWEDRLSREKFEQENSNPCQKTLKDREALSKAVVDRTREAETLFEKAKQEAAQREDRIQARHEFLMILFAENEQRRVPVRNEIVQKEKEEKERREEEEKQLERALALQKSITWYSDEDDEMVYVTEEAKKEVCEEVMKTVEHLRRIEEEEEEERKESERRHKEERERLQKEKEEREERERREEKEREEKTKREEEEKKKLEREAAEEKARIEAEMAEQARLEQEAIAAKAKADEEAAALDREKKAATRREKEAQEARAKEEEEEMKKKREEARKEKERIAEEKFKKQAEIDAQREMQEAQEKSDRKAREAAERKEEQRKNMERAQQAQQAKKINGRTTKSVEEQWQEEQDEKRRKRQLLQESVAAVRPPSPAQPQGGQKLTKSAAKRAKKAQRRNSSPLELNSGVTEESKEENREEEEQMNEKKEEEKEGDAREAHFEVARTKKTKKNGEETKFEMKMYVPPVPVLSKEDQKTAAAQKALLEKTAKEERQKQEAERASRETTPTERPSPKMQGPAKIKYKKEKSDLVDGVSREFHEEMKQKRKIESFWSTVTDSQKSLYGLAIVMLISAFIGYYMAASGFKTLPWDKPQPQKQQAQTCVSDAHSPKRDDSLGVALPEERDSGVPLDLKAMAGPISNTRPRMDCIAWLDEPITSPAICVQNDERFYFELIQDATNTEVYDQDTALFEDHVVAYGLCRFANSISEIENGVPVWWTGARLDVGKGVYNREEGKAAYEMLVSPEMVQCYTQVCLKYSYTGQTTDVYINQAAYCYKFLKVATRLLRITTSVWGEEYVLERQKKKPWIQLQFPYADPTTDKRLQYQDEKDVKLDGRKFHVMYSADIPLPMHPMKHSINRTYESVVAEYYEVDVNGSKVLREYDSLSIKVPQFDQNIAKKFAQAVTSVDNCIPDDEMPINPVSATITMSTIRL